MDGWEGKSSEAVSHPPQSVRHHHTRVAAGAQVAEERATTVGQDLRLVGSSLTEETELSMAISTRL